MFFQAAIREWYFTMRENFVVHEHVWKLLINYPKSFLYHLNWGEWSREAFLVWYQVSARITPVFVRTTYYTRWSPCNLLRLVISRIYFHLLLIVVQISLMDSKQFHIANWDRSNLVWPHFVGVSFSQDCDCLRTSIVVIRSLLLNASVSYCLPRKYTITPSSCVLEVFS